MTLRTLVILLACGVILAGAAYFTPKVGQFLAIAAVVLGGVVLVLELVTP